MVLAVFAETIHQREYVTGGLLRRGYAPWVARKALAKASELDS